MSDLVHIVYMSFSSKKLSESDLNDFLKLIRKKNQERGVTGLLLYKDEAFIQLIEGNKETIDQLFNIISKDSRHSNILKLLEEPIRKRAFPDWSMGFRTINNDQINQIPGFSDFMQNNHSKIDNNKCAEAVSHLLYSFRKHT
ncbi:FAD-dependent sensor of blue light [Ancylomarina subtilis]|uniref:FAD-dependent sensor of blue light n=1 Tax=Ancylomarina subtilis TaxID=1639035 RepID=A0A4Q7VIL5_9BACT|nr:BLUF domain-containing protein [Ancylomarina subtilis]RZT95973.1 FAD-dependent sensor of blue light [Ancylomarina subtilis]